MIKTFVISCNDDPKCVALLNSAFANYVKEEKAREHFKEVYPYETMTYDEYKLVYEWLVKEVPCYGQ